MIMHLRPLAFSLNVLALMSLPAALCLPSQAGPEPVFATEKAQTAPLPEKTVLQGKASQSELDSYAKTTSTAPLLQGTVTQSMPFEWKGLWAGGVQLNELGAQSNGGRTLNGSTINLQLNLESAQNGTKIFDLSVHQLASQVGSGSSEESRRQLQSSGANEPDPDIHFWHTGNESHLLIKNGASMHVGGTMVIGGASGTNSVVEITGRGSSLGGFAGGSSNSNTIPSTDTTKNLNYDGNAISTTGATSFKGHYFKSDDRISLKGAQIQTDRIDIGNQTTMTNGSTALASGDGRSGYFLSRLQGDRIPSATLTASTAPTKTNLQGPINLIGGHEKLLSMKIVKIAPGIYDVETVTGLSDQNSPVGGSRQIISRYTALDPARMVVQMTIKNFDSNSRLTDTFTTSGYLYR
ncbi:MAG: hypothetical protein P4L53_07000 [Candidatus Obscuribacterales bacterium]|nr:hypothetical protein [Candidatus Obscuribacterales bacterium]